MFGISLFKKVSFFSKILLIIPILAIYILRCQRKKEERKKERKRAKTLKSAHLWLLLIVINLTYTRIGFVSLI